ncbi:MAG: thioredoxin fold domain-containing protein, partial [Thiohalobacterales bacterium]|nr:thioredoxin fold domain-containing protein [Thiohalobacterales bacterium]
DEAPVTGGDGAGQADMPVQPAAQEHPAKPVEALEAGMVNPGYEEKPDWFANSFLDIRDDVGEAAAAGKRVMLYFYQDGCPYCKKLLDTNFALADTVRRTRENFEVIAINMWGDREVTGLDGAGTTEKEFAKSLRVMFTPTLLFLDEEGGVVLRLNGYYPPHKFNTALDYAAQYSGSEPDYREYLAGVSPTPASGVLHQDASFLAPGSSLAGRTSGKPLLVMFEQKDCAPCDELHLDILKRPESRELLGRFDVLLLDMWSGDDLTLPDGRQSTPAKWARELGVQYAPSLLFFDTAGREVFRSEAYLKAFHVQSCMDYIASGAYLEQPEFQRYISSRAEVLEAQGVHVDLMN